MSMGSMYHGSLDIEGAASVMYVVMWENHPPCVEVSASDINYIYSYSVRIWYV